MNDRKVKGRRAIYIPLDETFVAKDGKTYRAVRDGVIHDPCKRCDFKVGMGLCWRYRCCRDDRADCVGVHFVRVEE